jgi:murein DD-endopeptidase
MTNSKKMHWHRVLCVFFVFVVTFYSVLPSVAQNKQQTCDVRVPPSVNYVLINKKPTLYYEIRIKCSPNDSTSLKKLDIVDLNDSAVIFSLTGNDLDKRFIKSEKAPGASGIIYLEYVIPSERTATIEHRYELERIRNSRTVTEIFTNKFETAPGETPIIVGAPLRAGPWAAIYEPSWERGHRRVTYTVNEKTRIPGRFAIDFIKMDNKGLYAKGTENGIKNWYGYGDAVIAVADGVVASTRNDFKESSTISGHKKVKPENGSGNYISLNIGNGHFAFYEHLKPGSIKVIPAQNVKKGDVIASLGFTGQSTGPHLHFHIADADSPLGAEGLPFAFESFTVLGSYDDFEKFGKSPWVPVGNSPQPETKERPAPNCIIQF